MKLAKLFEEEKAGDNLDTIVKIDQMPEYKVLNPTEEEKEEAQDDKKASLPAEVTDNPKEEKPEEKDKLTASKELVAKLLASITEFIKQI